ncbi:EF-hand domain-containing protein [Zavarzinia aquatilis]|uniref:EF-hand domain-containing protein n=1 Tax=Zavarzinia aquatilis TaxID=2211142 RepID=A0A317E8F9_9PROT|nr:EF-hand domain-containing protein [Zavarzinia aquatilis]PWR22546.1 hypothetical protein DKG74_11780 [Zavarzinia aquatilis]
MSSISSVSGSQATQSLFSKLDTNSDGTVSQDEFVASRPKDMSETDAAALYAKIDEDGTGALTEDQLKAGLDANRPPPPPPPELTGGAPSLSSDLVSALIDVLQQASEDDSSASSTSTATSASTSAAATASDMTDTEASGTALSGELLTSLYKAIQAYASSNNIALDSTSPTVNSVG